MNVTITTPVTTVAEFYRALSSQLELGGRRIANADALADILREKRVARVTVTGWGISLSDALLVLKVFRDLGVTLRFS